MSSENEDKEISEKEISEIKMKLGDIIKCESTNPIYNLQVFFVEYIDDDLIKMINIKDGTRQKLDLDSDGCLTDTTIQKIYLLSRSDEEGYARQNGLLPDTYVKLVFTDDVEIIGQITNLEEDMIEIAVLDDKPIFIDFEYKGIPKNIPLQNIIITDQPTIYETIAKKEKESSKESDKKESSKESSKESNESKEIASMSYTPTGEIIINIPENSVPDYKPVVGKWVDIYVDVEVKESEQRYGIDIQTTNLLDELLSTIPDYKRTSTVMERIYRIIRRFKELRKNFSTFDKNGNIIGSTKLLASYKPLVEHMNNLDTNLRWIIPVVKQKTKIYSEKVTSDVTIVTSALNADLEEYKNNMDVYKTTNNYASFYNGINNIFTPFESVTKDNSILKMDTVNTDLEAIVDNLENYYTYVYKKGDQIGKKRFFIQRYNLGMTKLNSKDLRIRENIGKNDSISIKSVIMLPKPALEFSRIDLPGTNILTRAGLSQNWMYYFKFLKNKTNFKNINIDDVNKEYNYEKETDAFLDSAISLRISKSINPDYNTILDTIIPRSVSIFRMLKSEYIGYNFYDVLAFYEPFLIYNDNITYSGVSKDGKNNELYQGRGGPYLELRKHIIENVKKYNDKLMDEKKKFNLLERIKSVTQEKNTIFRHINLDMQTRIIKEYALKNETASSTEFLNKMISLDNGDFYMSVSSLIMAKLYTPDLAKLMDSSDETSFSKSKSCSSHVIAKKYTSNSALQKDNGKEEVFFDKEYDTTPYDILKKYQESQKTKSPKDFLDYFTLVLQHEFDIHSTNMKMAEAVAKTIIAKKKLVEDNNYAVLVIYPILKSTFNENSLSEEEKESVEIESDVKKRVSYFKRKGDNWIQDTEIANSELANEMFCNTESDCFYDKNNNFCDTLDNVATRMKKIAKKNLYETTVALTMEDFKQELHKMYDVKELKIKRTRLLKEAKNEEFSMRAYNLGKKATVKEIVVSQYANIRDQILTQVDFIKKQENIIHFKNNYCRNAIEGESVFWLYCKESNVKLLPIFLYALAESFFNGLYEDRLNSICSIQGKLSDDGDAIVDKHSGYVICYRDFVAQEDFDDNGFVVKTHAVMEKDVDEAMDEAIAEEDKTIQKKYKNEINQYIYNVAKAVSKNMDIEFDGIEKLIIQHASKLIASNLSSKEDYEKKIAKEKKEKNLPYNVYKNKIIFFFTIAVTFIVIQTHVPSFHPKKTFPGCIYSLSGYPLETTGNNLGLNYLCCILEKMKTKTTEPWKSVYSMKKEALLITLTEYIEKKILDNYQIKKMLDQKREYLLLHIDTDIPEELNVEKWLLFQPPLIKSAIEKTVSGVSRALGNELHEALKTGHRSQHEHIGNLYKKMIEHTYSTVDSINKIVSDVGKDAMLKAGPIIFLENSCCEELSVNKAITYFAEKDENINKNIEFIQKYGKIYSEIKSLSIPSFATSKLTRTENVSVESNHYSDELKYLAYIHYCKLKTDLPIPDDLQDICQEKIIGLNTMNFDQSIQTLKDNGRTQTEASFANLMDKIFKRNQIEISFSDESDVPSFDNLEIEDNVIDKIKKALETKDDGSLNVFLDNLNKRMQDDIFIYLTTYGKLKSSDIQSIVRPNKPNEKIFKGRIVDFIENIAVWADNKNIPTFIKNTIHNITNVIPSMLNNESLKNINATRKHWDFAPVHYDNLTKFISEYFEDIQGYDRDEIICSLFRNISEDPELKEINLLVSQLVTITELNRETLCKVYKYCYLSVFSKIICESDESDYIKIEYTSVKNNDWLKRICDKNSAVEDVEIGDNKQILFQKVSNLLVIILNTDINNKKLINFNYSELSDKFHKDSLAEKKTITEKFRLMDKNDRKVEQEMKKYKLGDWFVDEGVYKYKKGKYEEEVEDIVEEGNESFVEEEGDEDRHDNNE